MAAFPSYDAALLKALDAQAQAMLKIFARKGYARAEPPILQPADVFLDRSGEEIRRRTFVLHEAGGAELCLRPELTIPLCRMHLQDNGKFPARLAYHGPAFRIPQSTRTRPYQFLQTGVECLGVEKRDAADAEVLQLSVESLRAAGLKNFNLRIGDLALFNHLVDALDIPLQWRGRLKRHFWRPDYFKALLERLSEARTAPKNPFIAKIAAAGIEGGDQAALACAERLMDELGSAPLGGRTREEIIERLLEQAAEAAAIKLDKSAVALIESVLQVQGKARAALDAIEKILSKAGISLDAPLTAMEKRLGVLKKLKLADASVTFAARFGRNMEYYTGVVFELWAKDREGAVQVAGGGRYDTLLRSLGSHKDIPAVGCAIRGERVLAAKRYGSKK